MGKQDGCLHAEGKETQAWDSAGQHAAEMAKDSGRDESFYRTEGFVPLAMAVTSTTEAYQEILSFEALDFISSSPLVWEAGSCHRIFLHLLLLNHTFNCPQEETLSHTRGTGSAFTGPGAQVLAFLLHKTNQEFSQHCSHLHSAFAYL